VEFEWMDGWYSVMVNGALLINNEIIYLISFIHACTHEAPLRCRCTQKRFLQYSKEMSELRWNTFQINIVAIFMGLWFSGSFMLQFFCWLLIMVRETIFYDGQYGNCVMENIVLLNLSFQLFLFDFFLKISGISVVRW